LIFKLTTSYKTLEQSVELSITTTFAKDNIMS